MKEFRLKADCVFEAENIDAALDKLSDHFASISEEEPTSRPIEFFGGIEVKVIE